MDYNIKGIGMDISSEVRSHLDKKLTHIEKLLKYQPQHPLDVELTYSPTTPQEKYKVSIRLPTNKHGYVHEKGSTLHEAIDRAVDEFRREMVRDKEKHIHSLRGHAARIKEYIRGFRRKP